MIDQRSLRLAHLSHSIHQPQSRERFFVMVFDLTSYMDETGHADDPVLNFAGMAGFVAPLKIWEAFGRLWQDVLDKAGLKEPFHMNEFAQSTCQFKSWKGNKERREALFGQLVELIVTAKLRPIGAIVSIRDFESLSRAQRESFKDPYYIAFQICTRGGALEGAICDPPEKVVMVYSFNKEFGVVKPRGKYSVDQSGSAEQLWHVMRRSTNFGKWMGAYSSSTPTEIVQLQAADLLAYELAKEFENQIKRPKDSMRWGLKRILPLAGFPYPMLRLLDRAELLRIVQESRFKCQDGTAEVSPSQMVNALYGIQKWMVERGGIKLRITI